ncbi:Asialoglycoprotein receptor 2 [Takifugu flavidus]|uniref:Asialoglycoprotein receptor 2 n=1 Tax=Takifugu flavidus TaxID=433684 RepID=A0A5C6PJQ3_9TELE|nr:Asialoglycoprotein receptor 2 [Takifugu flavidus]
MYITFCRSYEGDKNDGLISPDSKLCVQLDGEKSKKEEVKKEDKTRGYKLACLILSVLCLILLLLVIFLSTKPLVLPFLNSTHHFLSILAQTGSHFCPENELRPIPPTCSLENCQTLYNLPSNKRACQYCDEDWLPFGGSCYFLSTFRLSWSGSQKDCNDRGGSLAVIKSPEVQKFLSEESNLLYWIGLSQTNQTWTWVDNSRLQKSYWAENPGTGDCVYLYTDGHPEKNWIRKPCSAYTYFICQM